MVRRLVFDIETEPISEAFQTATTIEERIAHVPAMRLACLFDETTGAYHFFLPGDAGSLIDRLREADEVVSYNGNRFDLLVLCRHHGLEGRIPEKGRHVDLWEVMREKSGFMVSLDQAAKLNLGRGKHTHGRDMQHFDLEHLKVASRSDVEQTYALWNLYTAGTLKYPAKYEGYGAFVVESLSSPNLVLEYAGAMGSPDTADFETMSDGEQAEYVALLEGGGDEGWAIDMFGLDPEGYVEWLRRNHPSDYEPSNRGKE
jgi:hypothetical protein